MKSEERHHLHENDLAGAVDRFLKKVEPYSNQILIGILVAAVVAIGVIVSEISTGIPGGIGRAVISYGQAATSDPEKLYGAIFGAAALGLVLYGLVVLIELVVMRDRPREVPA